MKNLLIKVNSTVTFLWNFLDFSEILQFYNEEKYFRDFETINFSKLFAR